MTQIETRKGIIHYIEAIQYSDYSTYINITDKIHTKLILFLPTL